MIRILIITVFVLLNLWRFGWQSSANESDGTESPRVVYGEDNRMDFFEVEEPEWHQMAQSTVALFDRDDLKWNEDEQLFDIGAKPYGLSLGLCEDEPFFEQPTSSFCSGFLVESNILLTAGHCMRNQLNCERVRFAFGYNYSDMTSDPLRISEENIYRCQEILLTKNVAPTGADYAVVLLDRSVEGYRPLSMNLDTSVDEEAHLTVVGYPKGLPGKLAHGGRVRSNDKQLFFVADLDAFGGNSGSAVLNSETGMVEGILVRGEKDFMFDQQKRCRRSYRCKEGECRGEDVVRISEVVKDFKKSSTLSSN